jgi:hypothetical protein
LFQDQHYANFSDVSERKQFSKQILEFVVRSKEYMDPCDHAALLYLVEAHGNFLKGQEVLGGQVLGKRDNMIHMVLKQAIMLKHMVPMESKLVLLDAALKSLNSEKALSWDVDLRQYKEGSEKGRAEMVNDLMQMCLLTLASEQMVEMYSDGLVVDFPKQKLEKQIVLDAFVDRAEKLSQLISNEEKLKMVQKSVTEKKQVHGNYIDQKTRIRYTNALHDVDVEKMVPILDPKKVEELDIRLEQMKQLRKERQAQAQAKQKRYKEI